MTVGIRAMVFDLDGTLYVSEGLAANVRLAAAEYVARLRGTTPEAAACLVREIKERLSRESGTDATLTSACLELGGSIEGLHAILAARVQPESFLTTDKRVVDLVTGLASRYELYIYTNNNRNLADRILRALGLAGLFRRVFTIEDFLRPKPDRDVLKRIYSALGRRPDECLFVGDRYDVDLRIPAEMGSAVLLVSDTGDLANMRVPETD